MDFTHVLRLGASTSGNLTVNPGYGGIPGHRAVIIQPYRQVECRVRKQKLIAKGLISALPVERSADSTV